MIFPEAPAGIVNKTHQKSYLEYQNRKLNKMTKKTFGDKELGPSIKESQMEKEDVKTSRYRVKFRKKIGPKPKNK